MSKRYIAKDSFSLGRDKVFVTGHQQDDGTQGYTEQQVARLSRGQIKQFFKVVDVSGDTVEEATAEPGEKRMLQSYECSEDGCDFTSRTKAGIAAHERSH